MADERVKLTQLAIFNPSTFVGAVAVSLVSAYAMRVLVRAFAR